MIIMPNDPTIAGNGGRLTPQFHHYLSKIQTLSNPPAFVANLGSADQTGIASATNTKILFTNERYDFGGYYDATNSLWNPPRGIVILYTQLLYSGGTVDGATSRALIMKNGSVTLATATSINYTTSDKTASVYAVDLCSDGDYYEVYGFGSGAGTKTVSGATNSSYFTGFMIGAT